MLLASSEISENRSCYGSLTSWPQNSLSYLTIPTINDAQIETATCNFVVRKIWMFGKAVWSFVLKLPRRWLKTGRRESFHFRLATKFGTANESATKNFLPIHEKPDNQCQRDHEESSPASHWIRFHFFCCLWMMNSRNFSARPKWFSLMIQQFIIGSGQKREEKLGTWRLVCRYFVESESESRLTHISI
jgi:hypothetical protein